MGKAQQKGLKGCNEDACLIFSIFDCPTCRQVATRPALLHVSREGGRTVFGGGHPDFKVTLLNWIPWESVLWIKRLWAVYFEVLLTIGIDDVNRLVRYLEIHRYIGFREHYPIISLLYGTFVWDWNLEEDMLQEQSDKPWYLSLVSNEKHLRRDNVLAFPTKLVYTLKDEQERERIVVMDFSDKWSSYYGFIFT